MDKCTRCGGNGREPDPVSIGHKMRRLRENRGLTLRAVAQKLGFSPAYVSDLELGRRGWSAMLQKRYLDVVFLILAALLLACATSAAAETYWLEAKAMEPIGRRFYLARYGTVTLEPGEHVGIWLSLAACPGGVDQVFALYVNPTGPGAWDYTGPGWGYPTAYGTYRPASSMGLANFSDAPMTFRIKLSVRCEE